jgi:mono/diheme cytochrome c family protein
VSSTHTFAKDNRLATTRCLAIALAGFCMLPVCGFSQSASEPPTVSSGERIVRASCETCHSLKRGQVKIGPSLFGVLNTTKPKMTPEQVHDILVKGRNQMPSYRDIFTSSEIDSIVLYLREIP